MASLYTIDTEGTGLVSPIVLIQYRQGGKGKIHLHEVWKKPARDTLKLIDRFMAAGIRGWRLTHDHFHFQRTHNVLSLLPLDRPPTAEGWCAVEWEALKGPCVKPATACDVLLHAQRGKWQTLMNRENIKIRRVPRPLAEPLRQYLQETIQLDAILFNKRENGYEWQVVDDPDDMDFPDVVLRFGAIMGLKAVASHVRGEHCPDLPVEKSRLAEENLWDPLGSRDWVRVLPYHIGHWNTNPRARKYAMDDVAYTDEVWESLGSPPSGDIDSILACQVASARWRGFAVDQKAVEALLAESTTRMEAFPRSPQAVLHGLKSRCSDVEALSIENTTGVTLERIGGQWSDKTQLWTGGWPVKHKAVPFARGVIRARTAEKERDAARKLQGRRLHPDAKIMGTFTGRFAGAGGFNYTGLSDSVKQCLTLADGSLPVLDGGDAWSFEVCIAAAVYKDKKLTAALRKHKMHALFAAHVLEMRYEDIYDDEHDKPVNKPIYQQGKVALLAKMYGAQDPKLASIFGIPVGQVRTGSAAMDEDYPGIKRATMRIERDFSAMVQVKDRGRIEWREPKQRVDSMFGYSRDFSLEWKIAKALYEVAQNPPESLRVDGGLVQRRSGRTQTIGGATQTALFACAFGTQATIQRAAKNHEIQATGAKITKEVQGDIWELQPSGVHPWVVQPLNEHDSVMVSTTRKLAGKPIDNIVQATVGRFREQVPLLRIDWKTNIPNWRAK